MYRNEEDEWRRRDAAIHSKILEKERVTYDSQVKSNLFFNKVFKDFLEFEGLFFIGLENQMDEVKQK